MPLSLPAAFAGIELLTPSSLGKIPFDLEDQQATALELVKREWSKAKTFPEKSVDGIYEGRCYFRDRPNQPAATLLVVTDQIKNAHGILKGISERKSIMQIVDRKIAPDGYSKKKLDAKTKAKIEALARQEQKQSSFAYQVYGQDEALMVDYYRNETRDAFQLNLRRLGNQIYVRVMCNERGYCLNSHGRSGRFDIVALSGEAPTYCYYFRRLAK